MRIDAHQHFWDPSLVDYGWLTPAEGALYHAFQPGDLAPLIAAAGIDGTVIVQAAPIAAESDYLLSLARATPWVLGVVGWIDLDAADVTEQITGRAADPLFVGVRPMLQDMADRRWILDPRHAPALAKLTDAGLVFDALVRADQIDAIAELARRHPDLSIVLDHAGKPAITAAGPDPNWIASITRLAAHGNVACKLSGLLSEAPPQAAAALLAPYFRVLRDAFGPGRLLWGSDWPVLTVVSDYGGWHTMTESLIPAIDREAIFGGNARHLYRLEHRS